MSVASSSRSFAVPQKPAETHASARFRDYFVAFFGALLPGFFFLIFLLPIFVFPVLAAAQGFFPRLFDDVLSRPAESYSDLGLQLLLACGILTIAYVIGFGFFRQDPKVPDTISYLLHGENDGPAGLRVEDEAMRPKRLIAKFWWSAKVLCSTSIYKSCKIEYPYLHLRKYLLERRLDNLAEYVDWDDVYSKPRTKHVINEFKIALNVFCSWVLGPIAQNEAHIRLSSSVWYAIRSLASLASCGLVASVCAFIVAVTSDRASYQSAVAIIITAFFVGFGVLMWLSWTILRALHYQRVRELLWVLQTVDCARRISPALDAYFPVGSQVNDRLPPQFTGMIL